MKIEVRFRGVIGAEPLREHAVRRVHLHLSRFGTDLSRVVVRVADENGPKGGIDKRCRVTVRGPKFGSLTLDELAGDAESSVDYAVERIARALGRTFERARAFKGARGDGWVTS